MVADVSSCQAFADSCAQHQRRTNRKPLRVELNLEGCRQMAGWCLPAVFEDYRAILEEILHGGIPAVRKHFDGAVVMGVPTSFKPDNHLLDPAVFIS